MELVLSLDGLVPDTACTDFIYILASTSTTFSYHVFPLGEGARKKRRKKTKVEATHRIDPGPT